LLSKDLTLRPYALEIFKAAASNGRKMGSLISASQRERACCHFATQNGGVGQACRKENGEGQSSDTCGDEVWKVHPHEERLCEDVEKGTASS